MYYELNQGLGLTNEDQKEEFDDFDSVESPDSDWEKQLKLILHPSVQETPEDDSPWKRWMSLI